MAPRKDDGGVRLRLEQFLVLAGVVGTRKDGHAGFLGDDCEQLQQSTTRILRGAQ